MKLQIPNHNHRNNTTLFYIPHTGSKQEQKRKKRGFLYKAAQLAAIMIAGGAVTVYSARKYKDRKFMQRVLNPKAKEVKANVKKADTRGWFGKAVSIFFEFREVLRYLPLL